MEIPETRYAAVGDADVAYQVVGDGPLDLCYFVGIGQIDLRWDHPLWAGFLERLASFSRLIVFDRRGTGASDAVPNNLIPSWEEWTDDVSAVLDAVASERAAIFAEQHAGPIAMLFAAIHPERVTELVLANTSSRIATADDYPIGLLPEVCDALAEIIGAIWGTPESVRSQFPGRADDVEFARWLAKIARAALTPRSAVAQYRNWMDMDVRQALPLIQAPTLVLHSRNPLVPIDHGRYVADHIVGAKFVALSDDDAYVVGSAAAIDEITEFLTGERPVQDVDRILTTVLFTDIVGSTERLASMGDHRWRTVLDAHDRRT